MPAGEKRADNTKGWEKSPFAKVDQDQGPWIRGIKTIRINGNCDLQECGVKQKINDLFFRLDREKDLRTGNREGEGLIPVKIPQKHKLNHHRQKTQRRIQIHPILGESPTTTAGGSAVA